MAAPRPDSNLPGQRSKLRALLASLLPGALAGTQIAGLLFFLNPHLPFEIDAILRGVLFYGALLSIPSALCLLPLLRRRSVGGVLPWAIVVVLAAAGLVAWIHASYYAFYLPSGINRRLLKAAILLSIAALVGFYTALIHVLRGRPYGRRSRLLFALLAIASIYVVLERREAFKPPIEPSPRATTLEGESRPQLCVVGLEAATLDAILPLAEQGRLPFFGKMLQEGAYARLSSLRPTLRDPLWTTAAVGKYPFQHGVVGEKIFEPLFLPKIAQGPNNERYLNLLPIGLGFETWGALGESRATDSRDQRVLALWEILSRLGVSTGLVGWPLTAPAPEGIRIGLSERYFESSEGAGNVWPEELAERARLFRTRSEEIDPSLRSRFGSQPPAPVLRALVGDLWREQLSFFLLEQEPRTDAFFVVLPGLREISKEYFGGFAAVQFEGSQHPDARRGDQLLTAYYGHLDDFLARFWERCSPPSLLAVISVHGVEEPSGWRKILGALRRQTVLGGSLDNGPDGVLFLLGEGIQPGAKLRTAQIVDMVPTLLYGLGFPIALDSDGSVLTNAFETSFLARKPLTFLPSYETFAAPK